jgi:Tfp pilus assembly protein PilX
MSLYQLSRIVGPHRYYGNNHGIALVTALMFIVIIALLGATTTTMTTLSSQASGNYKASIQSFQAAEAGAEEARARLRANATSPIVDAAPTQTTWQAYIGSTTQAQAYGYTSAYQQVRTDSLQTALPYTVVITHATNASGQILYWGDPTGSGTNIRNTTTGKNIYLITSYGTAGGGHSTVQTQVAGVPPIPITGTVYVNAETTLQGSSTYIDGNDACGSTPSLPGVVTPLAATHNGHDTITQNGNPVVLGDPAILYNASSRNIAAMVNSLKGSADYSYALSSATVAGMSWGTPTAGATQQSALSCAASESHIVYYNMGGTSLRLTGGTEGCGILLVDGDLEIHGNFSWYGPVLVTGSIIYTGGGNKNISGALLSGGSVLADVIGGNATILNCSQALTNPTQNRPLLVLNWEQI